MYICTIIIFAGFASQNSRETTLASVGPAMNWSIGASRVKFHARGLLQRKALLQPLLRIDRATSAICLRDSDRVHRLFYRRGIGLYIIGRKRKRSVRQSRARPPVPCRVQNPRDSTLRHNTFYYNVVGTYVRGQRVPSQFRLAKWLTRILVCGSMECIMLFVPPVSRRRKIKATYKPTWREKETPPGKYTRIDKSTCQVLLRLPLTLIYRCVN